MSPSKPHDPVQWSDGTTSLFEYDRGGPLTMPGAAVDANFHDWCVANSVATTYLMGDSPAEREDLVCVCPTGTTETVFVVPKSEH